MVPRLASLRASYGAQQPLNPGTTKNEKNTKFPHPGLGPKNTKKKLRKLEFGHFWTMFGGPEKSQPGVGDFFYYLS